MRCRVVVALIAFAIPASAVAQNAPARPLHRLEIAVGGGLLTGGGLGSEDATLRTRDAGSFPLFRTDSRFGRAGVLEARAGIALSRRYAIEAGLGFSQPELRTVVSSDVEGVPNATLAERVDRYVIDGALIVMLDRWRAGAFVPFASAGAGYLRQLHEGLTLVEEGTAYHVGGGVKRWFLVRDRGVVKAIGVRGDARLYLLAGGIDVGNGPRPRVAVSGSLFVTF